jgi:hypothetical protein
MTTVYTFTSKHAMVFGRYIEYNYKKAIETFKEWNPDYALDENKDELFPNNFVFRFENVKCTLAPLYNQNELNSIRMDFCFFGKEDYFIKHFSIGTNINFKKIILAIYSCVGLQAKICVCDQQITNHSFDKCEECFVFNVKREDNCCICLDNGYRWVKLVCDCKNGRYIHRHCFEKLSANFDKYMNSEDSVDPHFIWKKKCPCCRKEVSAWSSTKDVIEDPDFY